LEARKHVHLLPGRDGLECLDLLRECRGMEQTPVILMSAGLPEGVQMRGRVQDRTDLIFASEAIRDGYLAGSHQTPP
jgi:hypothetical protein